MSMKSLGSLESLRSMKSLESSACQKKKRTFRFASSSISSDSIGGNRANLVILVLSSFWQQ